MTIASPTQSVKPRRSRRRPWQSRIDQRRLAQLIPAQGEWTPDDYLWLTRDTNRLIELADGWIEELPVPTETHQRVSKLLFRRLDAWLDARQGLVYYSPLRVQVAEFRFREPDLVAILDQADPRRGDKFWTGVDLAIEIISPSNADHDLVTKRAEYAAAQVAEYWIADSDAESVTVLTLDACAYREHGCFNRGQMLTSPLLPGLTVAIDEIFAER